MPYTGLTLKEAVTKINEERQGLGVRGTNKARAAEFLLSIDRFWERFLDENNDLNDNWDDPDIGLSPELQAYVKVAVAGLNGHLHP